jgi:pimeloyl-ACP methyl ester carboxylesterase
VSASAARCLLVTLVVLALSAGPAGADTRTDRFDGAVDSILAEPYQPAYVPQGDDSAFADPVPNTAPAQDYTTGSIPVSPDAPAWPPSFTQVLLHSADGAPLLGELALHGDVKRPGVVVVHGFNTHGYASVIRWAAMLFANGYDVLAADQRDFNFEWAAGYGDPTWLQTFGWKESEDVLAAGRYLAAQPGVTSVGLVGFSEGGQNTVLALALDAQAKTPVFDAGLQFSGPADQDTQIYSTAVPAGCASPFCTYPATDALVQLVVPPYTQADVCTVLARSAARYGTDGFGVLSHETAVHAQMRVGAPLLSFYSADDSLVPAFQARMMAAYEVGNPLQLTVELQRGEHAYFYDRWWQQRAILLYFKAMLPAAAKNPAVTATPTVNQTAGGLPAGAQQVDLGSPTRSWADARLAPYICGTTRGAPGAAG